MLAYQVLQDEKCGQCGMPVYICHNESQDVEFNFRSDVCSATAKVEKGKERLEQKKNYKSKPGEQHYAEWFSPTNKPQWEIRDSYYEAEEKRLKALEALNA